VRIANRVADARGLRIVLTSMEALGATYTARANAANRDRNITVVHVINTAAAPVDAPRQ